MSPFTRAAAFALGAVCVASLLICSSAPAQSRDASANAAGQRPRGKRAVKPVPVPATRVITAEELAPLLKGDGTRFLLVNYWATWCDPCREEFPDLVKIDHDFRTKGLDTIAISLDDLTELKSEVPKFLSLMKAQMPNYLLNVADPEPSIKLVDPTWAGALPATFLYDASGAIVYKKFGRFDTKELRTAIEKLVGSRQEQTAGAVGSTP